jgi:hypothetical protein
MRTHPARHAKPVKVPGTKRENRGSNYEGWQLQGAITMANNPNDRNQQQRDQQNQQQGDNQNPQRGGQQNQQNPNQGDQQGGQPSRQGGQQQNR